MATRKNTAPAVAQSVDASPDIQRTIAEAIELVETTQRALESNEQRASEYGALGQAVAKLWAAHNHVELLPSGAPAPADLPSPLADAIAAQQDRAWQVAKTLRALGENRDDEGVSPHAVLLVADAADQLADALDSVNLPQLDAPSAPDFGSVAAAVTEQYGALRLAYLALSEFHDAPAGYVVTKDDTETLGAVHSQIACVVAELDDLAAELMGRGAQS